LGHLTHVDAVDILRIRAMRDHGFQFFVEINLTSNKATGSIRKRKDNPLLALLLQDIPVLLGTDGQGVMGTSLPREYCEAADMIFRFRKGEFRIGVPENRCAFTWRGEDIRAIAKDQTILDPSRDPQKPDRRRLYPGAIVLAVGAAETDGEGEWHELRATTADRAEHLLIALRPAANMADGQDPLHQIFEPGPQHESFESFRAAYVKGQRFDQLGPELRRRFSVRRLLEYAREYYDLISNPIPVPKPSAEEDLTQRITAEWLDKWLNQPSPEDPVVTGGPYSKEQRKGIVAAICQAFANYDVTLDDLLSNVKAAAKRYEGNLKETQLMIERAVKERPKRNEEKDQSASSRPSSKSGAKADRGRTSEKKAVVDKSDIATKREQARGGGGRGGRGGGGRSARK
jgi:hypothetical protein